MASARSELQESPILNLSTEVSEAIIEQADFGDLKALNLVSRSFYAQASRRLFRTLKFWADEHNFFVAPPLGTRMYDDLRVPRPLSFMKLVKGIQFQAPVFHRTWCGERCAYYEASRWMFKSYTPKIARLFGQLEKDSLRGFHWQLATCIPDDILNAGSCLVEEQSAIETMSLITFQCPKEHEKKPYVLTKFKRIRSFSWIGLESLSDVKAARDFLKSNRKILQSLELSFVDWSEVQNKWNSHQNIGNSVDNVFARHILPRGSDNLIQEFQSLRYLSLSEAPFTDSVLELVSALNTRHLRFLKLENCANAPKFLDAVATAKTPLILSRLELVMEDHIEADWTSSALIRLLQSFQGLEDLYILINPACPALTYWQAVADHKSTLRNFAYHERVRWSGAFGDMACKDQYLGYGLYQCGPLRTGHQLGMMLACGLDCLGYCDSSRGFQEYFQSHHDKLKPFTFKLLHIRRYENEVAPLYPTFFASAMAKGEEPTNVDWSLREHYDLLSCVQWAFTCGLFPNLRILAFGDSAYNGRSPDKFLLFCREARRQSNFAFRMMKKTDWIDDPGTRQPFNLAEHEMVQFEGIHRPFEFLAACPVDKFVRTLEGYSNWPLGSR